ncbi:CHAT domain-containing protein [Oscillatoria salina]|uniref:CHAT domain-containing protein n=1 Tax=Oscillatoria salina TaxID=331517 RepID=UPI0013BADC8F|nr:CHAT domain-containing protein [Oscillatoria salina]MBZ8178544.1 CHAT domain-containing protein [Oscillatoria salina IIICB1]NET86910.1 CHAT domain-containing protein [Kamptonema sp. SIO1D9]
MLNSSPDIYRSFEKVLVAQNRLEAALEVAEQGRISLLKNFLANHLLVKTETFPDFSPLSSSQIQQIAKTAGITLVYYSVLYDRSQFYQFYRFNFGNESAYIYPTNLFIWLLKTTGEMIFKQVNLKPFWQQEQISLGGLVRSIREFSDNADRENYEIYRQNLAYLYQLLIEPIAELLPQDPEAVVGFIPQDFLFLVPFAALVSSEQKYLIEKHTIVTLPSLGMLNFVQQKSPPKKSNHKSVLVVGNADFSNLNLPTLPLNEQPKNERVALAIATLFKTTPVLGKRATKTNILNQITAAKIIHLASQGFLSDEGSITGAIALAPEKESRGLLTIRNWLNLQLQAELIVLSGCDTKPGNIWGHGGEILATTLLIQGAESVILSLWSLPDAPQEILFSEFYLYFLAYGNKPQALRQAMLATMKRYPHPKYWSGFALFGVC